MDLSNRYLKAWLSFNTSPTEDAKLNQWTTYGNPTIGTKNAFNDKALQLDGSSYIKLAGVQLGGQDFYIDGWCFVDSSSPNYARVLSIVNPDTGYYMISVRKSATDATKLDFWANSYADVSQNYGYTYVSSINSVGERVHFKLIYRYSDKIISLCINDVIAAEMSTRRNDRDATQYNRQTFDIYVGASSSGGQGLIGTVDELRIYDGTWLAYNYGTPPTLADYQNITFSVDVKCKIKNSLTTWRYVNLGSADSLITTGTTLNNLPESKSKTGNAFYQTQRAKCFDIPATSEIWIKFDVYFDGTNRWRAYNDKDGEFCGVCSYTNYSNGDFGMWQNNNRVQDWLGICKTNQLQTVLLHMVSGSSAGVIEAWVDEQFIYRYTGDVNHGEDFADIYLQSDGAGTFFSNVIISNREIGLNDGYISFTADVQRKLSSIVEFTADVQRGIMEVINVPFIFGDHFNHCCSVEYDAPTTSIGRPLKIKLPNKSKAYVHATALNGGAFKVFSDTDAVGTVTGDVYAALDECESVFVQKVVAPQSILYMFLNSLRYRGGSALDSAIENCTYGVFPSKDELVNSFLNDLDNSESNLDFLSRCCGVDLSNDDTGAVIGSDAGGGYPKTAKSIVPEPVPVEDWIVPEKGSSKTIASLTVYFPTSGYKGTLTDAENHILAGLNSVWIEQALLLIQRSCNIDFRTNQTNIVHDISVKFVDENNDALAYVSITTKDGRTTSLELRVNMRRYSGINMTSEDGAAGSNTYLDRVLAHEMTHAVMAARIKNYTELPRFLREGIAEFIHGIDDERKSDIQYLTQTAQRNTLQSIFSTGGDSGDINIYSAGYLFFRYMIKQTLEKGTFPLERYSSTGHIRLFISDGAVDYFGNALTDNTRQIFYPDVSRTLAKAIEDFFDISILSVIPVELFAAVKRALLSNVNLFTRDKENFFSDETNPFVNPTSTVPASSYSPPASADLPINTDGLQNFEIAIAEQQLTDQVRFSAVTPFDIMQQVKGQYLDYPYNMRVERVQQQGIIYSCDCCSDVDQLLYTQMAYKIPATTTWWKIDGEEVDGTPKTVEIETVYPAASAHVNLIANALHLTPVMQFDNFLSTVLMDEQGGVTYNDLIRDIFGWSSRVPTMLINVIIRDGKLFVIQRGHESHSVDISKAQMTVPVITKELVRTTWGSTPWSKTTTYESEFHSFVPADVVIGQGGQGGDDERVREVMSQFNGNGTQGHTTFKYDEAGRLIQTYTYVYDSNRGGQNTYTTVNNYYDDDGTMIATETFTQSIGTEGQSTSRSVDEKHYITLPNGEKFLSQEVTKRWQNDSGLSITDNDLVDSRVTVHHPSRVGQSHVVTVSTDGEVVGEAGGQNTGDDRVTPFRNKKAFDFANSFDTATGEWKTQTQETGMTVNGLSLYDSSFPIHDQATLIKVTNALRNLNRKTKETVNVTLYDFQHLIDFDDKIILNGATYFLSSNTARTTPRIKFEQNLSLVRWY